MTPINELQFCRRFSVNFYKSLKFPLLEMSCYKDWINTDCGDPYPVTFLANGGGKISETVGNQWYNAWNAGEETCCQARLLGMHFPYASYEMQFGELTGTAGFRFYMPGVYGQTDAAVIVTARRIRDGSIRVEAATEVNGETIKSVCIAEKLQAESFTLLVSCRCSAFDVYWNAGEGYKPLGIYRSEDFAPIVYHKRFVRSTASVYTALATAEKVSFKACAYLDAGVSQADVKCMHYEDGTPIMENGRLFLTMSARLEEGAYQAVVSWNPSGCDFKLEGAFFYDMGDDAWCSDMAASAMYDRRAKQWYVWACAFSHGHVLCHAVCTADLRHGIHVLDAELMPAKYREDAPSNTLSINAGLLSGNFACKVDDNREFFAKSGDEDPDLIFDEANDRWLLAICRDETLADGRTAYRYHFYQSKEPFARYTYIGKSSAGANTGGSFIRYDGKLWFICGSDFDKRAQYHIIDVENPDHYELLKFNYDDGGFRGWGTLIAVPCGRRTRYLHITFDRHGGSAWRWSYGNLYVFEADEMMLR